MMHQCEQCSRCLSCCHKSPPLQKFYLSGKKKNKDVNLKDKPSTFLFFSVRTMSPECLGFPAMNVTDTASPCDKNPNINGVFRLKSLGSEFWILRRIQPYLSVNRINLLHHVTKASVVRLLVESRWHHQVEKCGKEWRLGARGQLWCFVLEKNERENTITADNLRQEEHYFTITVTWGQNFFGHKSLLERVLENLLDCVLGDLLGFCSIGSSGVFLKVHQNVQWRVF